MGLYKYLEPRWARRMLSEGALRVGTLRDFRRIEALGRERGDEHEGVRIAMTDGRAALFPGEEIPWFVRDAFRVPAHISMEFVEGARLVVRQTAPDMYVYCTCSRFDEGLLRSFGGACVEITDPAEVFRQITDALDGWTRHGVRRISGLRVAECRYEDREQVWPDATPHDPVFRKPLAYAHQWEVRAAWSTRNKDIHPENLVIPGIRDYLRAVA